MASGDKVELGDITIKDGPYPELTWVAVVVGWAIGALIAVSIAYAALILGFSIEGSELAAILGWGVLRGVMRRTSILENNINQTIASSVNGASSGIMFTAPALYILAKTKGLETVDDFITWGTCDPQMIALMIFASITGCILGLAFVIPLRKQMIDFDRLAYPGGIAVATILKSPGAGIKKATLLGIGALISGLIHLVVLITMGEDHDWALGSQLGLPSMLNIVFYISIMTIGVGYLSGKGGFWFGAGGFLCYFVLSPLLQYLGSENVQGLVDTPNAMRLQLYRPTGIGMLIGAAVGGIIAAFPLIRSALRSMHAASKRASEDVAAKNDEMPIKLLYSAVICGAIVMVAIAFMSSSEMTIGRALVMALLGTLWVWVAGVIVSECVGRTNWSPLSGMTLIAVTIVVLIAKAGMSDPAAVIASMVVGVAICLAISQASDMMLDLKSGYLVGAIPRRQQFAQYIGSWLGPCIVIFLMILLHQQYEIGSDNLPAPQATALASVVDGIMSDDVPSYRYAAGAGLGLLLAFSGLGGIGVLVGLGFYMPFNIVLTYTIGNVLRIVSDKTMGRKFAHDVGIPVAAGLIVGEALVGVGYALVMVFGGGH
ncbi:MAG: OPT/YSL family transporter [Planctomycetota bacterium]